MQLLSRLIKSSVEPFYRDLLIMDVMIMTYTSLFPLLVL